MKPFRFALTPASAWSHVFLVAALLSLSAASAFANTTHLVCRPPDSPSQTYLEITIDYGKRTAVFTPSSHITQIGANGAAAQPAQISDTEIRWQLVTKRANGNNYAEHFSLSRYNGVVSIYDDGTRGRWSWNCQVSAAPKKKF